MRPPPRSDPAAPSRLAACPRPLRPAKAFYPSPIREGSLARPWEPVGRGAEAGPGPRPLRRPGAQPGMQVREGIQTFSADKRWTSGASKVKRAEFQKIHHLLLGSWLGHAWGDGANVSSVLQVTKANLISWDLAYDILVTLLLGRETGRDGQRRGRRKGTKRRQSPREERGGVCSNRPASCLGLGQAGAGCLAGWSCPTPAAPLTWQPWGPCLGGMGFFCQWQILRDRNRDG